MVLLAAVLGVGRVDAESQRSFTADERVRLAAGELVERPREEHRGSLKLIGGTSFQVIDAPPSVVWQALVDTPRYPRMMPQLLEAREVERRPGSRKLLMRQGSEGLLERSYYLDVSYDRMTGDIEFRMDEDRPHDLEAAWGFYNIRAYGPRQTLLSYGVMASLGDGLLSSMLRGTLQEWMLKTPWMVKRFVEGSGRWLYDWRPVDPRS